MNFVPSSYEPSSYDPRAIAHYALYVKTGIMPTQVELSDDGNDGSLWRDYIDAELYFGEQDDSAWVRVRQRKDGKWVVDSSD